MMNFKRAFGLASVVGILGVRGQDGGLMVQAPGPVEKFHIPSVKPRSVVRKTSSASSTSSSTSSSMARRRGAPVSGIQNAKAIVAKVMENQNMLNLLVACTKLMIGSQADDNEINNVVNYVWSELQGMTHIIQNSIAGQLEQLVHENQDPKQLEALLQQPETVIKAASAVVEDLQEQSTSPLFNGKGSEAYEKAKSDAKDLIRKHYNDIQDQIREYMPRLQLVGQTVGRRNGSKSGSRSGSKSGKSGIYQPALDYHLNELARDISQDPAKISMLKATVEDKMEGHKKQEGLQFLGQLAASRKGSSKSRRSKIKGASMAAAA